TCLLMLEIPVENPPPKMWNSVVSYCYGAVPVMETGISVQHGNIVFTGSDAKEVVGIGANLPPSRIDNKVDVVRRAIAINQPNPRD
ncbi:nicotinate-nucleotide--dimethylbenzimidazole phosphoribosyltransferase, partial [Salmonella enterica subsp. enterica serovar Montevideo]|nr:nicotinate-nucleotide--dimethylbenzimidazole phosphoribosyltransferase [Salmonella enterica subsp. enterica serovar Montevideo]